MRPRRIPIRDTRPAQEDTLRRAVPAWATSLVLHVVLVFLLAATISAVPRGATIEPERTTGIVLKHIRPSGEYYEGEANDVEQASKSTKSDAKNTAITPLPAENELPFDPARSLLKKNDGVGLPAANGAGAGGGNLNLGGKAPGSRNIKGGQAETGVFGLTGVGHKFVYVFDSSASMSAPEGRPLAAAKRELIESLKSLGRTHQFQIIFYNRTPRIFNPTGVPGRLAFGTEPNKRLAAQFVAGVPAQLDTDHLPAILMAINMRPDVIFFLTDGERPPLYPVDLARIRRQNDGRSSINVIQFGTGGAPVGENWLKRLSRENVGEYTFLDVRRLSPTR